MPKGPTDHIKSIMRHSSSDRPSKEERQEFDQEETKEQLLIRRVFKDIAYHYFNDHKMIAWYVGRIQFSRQLGNDIANYVQGKNPKYFQKMRKESKG